MTPELPVLPVIAMLGSGSMGGAILSGLLGPEVVRAGDVRVTTRSAASAAALAGTAGITVAASEDDPEANRQAVSGAEIVVVAVKPYAVLALLAEIAPALTAGTRVVSVAAGIPTRQLAAVLPDGVAVLRAMPNTPSSVGLGVTGLAPGSRASDTDVEAVRAVFATVGHVIVLPEERIDALAALSGSGPAYVFYLLEQFGAIARDYGFTEDEARVLVEGTARGSLALLDASDADARELRRRVTSPNGTTERAIAAFDEAGLPAILRRATDANVARSAELAAD